MKHKLIYFLLLWCSLSAVASNYVIINEVMYDTPLNEVVTYPPFSNGEFIELYNGGSASVPLSGWTLVGDSYTEIFNFPDISIPSHGYLIVAYRHINSSFYNLAETFPAASGKSIIYQNDIVLSNQGETITLYNSNAEIVDQLYYDGTSHVTKPDRLFAENDDCQSDCHCVSLHRTWLEFDEDGRVVQGTSQWKTDSVSFSLCQLAEPSFYEHYLVDISDSQMGDNFIMSITPLNPTSRVSITNQGISVSSGVRTKATIQYYDGLGRPIELIALENTPNKDDLVQTSYYKGLHNAVEHWLPIPLQSEGQYIDADNVKTAAQSYYQDSRPFMETMYENSALEREVGYQKPGDTWNGHPSSTSYLINGTSDNIRIYSIVRDSVLKTTGDIYANNVLYKTVEADEDGKSVATFSDKLGRKIAEERAGNYTYFVYDDLGRLRYVLPHISPSKLANGEYPPCDTILRAAAYYYKYDNRGNLIYKRLPGCEPQLMVYDKVGQLILKQDGNQRIAGKWTIFAYDSIGRNLYSAELSSTLNQQFYMSIFSDRWYVEHYGNNPSNTSIPGTGYASSVFPKNNLKLLTINYYDDYHYLTRLTNPLRQALKFAQESGYGLQHEDATGLLTGTRVYNLSEDGFTANSYYYDAHGRLVQNRSICDDISYRTATSTEYLFDGSVSQQLSIQTFGENVVREHYQYSYDYAGRLLKTSYKLNNNEEIILSSFSYDSIGRLVQNLLHNNGDTITYSYDIRNMLTETKHNRYREYLNYANEDNDNITPCYNGNISSIYENRALRAYDYDNMNRLTVESGFMNKYQLGMVKIPIEEFAYDDVGNLISIKRYHGDDLTLDYGNDGNQLLSITENGESSDLYGVIEFTDRETETEHPLLYDANGNLIKDAYRYISCIKYNILNLPDTIQFSNGHQIVNMYDASGRKYKSINFTNKRTVNTDYNDIAYYTYNTDSIEYQVTEYLDNIMNIRTMEDSVITDKQKIFNTTGYYTDGHYYHYIKNHLGSICLVIESEQNSIVQNISYSVSGIPSLDTNFLAQPYLYNGKEYITAHGLNEYDSQARMYYATIMRTTTMDPHAENSYHISPYVWCGNNPINRIDPNGMDDLFDEEGRYLIRIDNNTDYVMIKNSNGGQRSITDFSYAENDVANREMLANIGTYYAHQVGLNQTLDVCDVEREGAIALTEVSSDFRQVYMAVVNGKIDAEANAVNNIMSALVHEGYHVETGTKGPMAEIGAIQKQANHPTWSKTTESYQKGIIGYLIYNANQAIKLQGQSPSMLENMINSLNLSHPIWFINNQFSYGIQEVESIGHKRK